VGNDTADSAGSDDQDFVHDDERQGVGKSPASGKDFPAILPMIYKIFPTTFESPGVSIFESICPQLSDR
jgi:hypothetical protein